MSVYYRGRPNKYNALTNEGTKPPNVVGEYRIRYRKLSRIKYIGITKDLERRMNEHKRSGKINQYAPYFEWMAAVPGTPYNVLREHEHKSIIKHNPYLNKNKGGGGKEPKIIRYYGLPREESLTQKISGAKTVEFDGQTPTINSQIEKSI